jgi:hypothetical protein
MRKISTYKIVTISLIAVIVVLASNITSQNFMMLQNHTLGKLTNVQIAYGQGSLSNSLLSPSNNLPGVGVNYAFLFTGGANDISVTSIQIQLPAYTGVANAQSLILSQGIPSTVTATVTNAGSGGLNPTVTVTLSSPVNMNGINIVLYIAKFSNPAATNQLTATFTTFSGTTPEDTGSAHITPTIYTSPSVTDTGGYSGGAKVAGFVGINNPGPQHTLDILGDIGVSSNIVSTSSSAISIKAPNGLCLGNC